MVVAVVAQHTVEPQNELAGHGDDSDGMIFCGSEMKVEAAQMLIAANGVVSGFDEQEAQQAVALFGNVAETLGIAAGMFSRIEAAVGGDAPRAIEARDRIERVHDRERSEQADARMSAQASDARVGLRTLLQLHLDSSDLLGQSHQQSQRMLALYGESASEWKSGQALLAGSGEKFCSETQAVAESDGLQTIAQHGANAHQAMAVAQQREDFAASRSRNMNGGKIPVTEQVQQELRVAAIVFLPAAGELANGQRVTDQQLVTEFFTPMSAATGNRE